METTAAAQFHPLGDTALLVSWGNIIGRDLNRKVHSLARAIQSEPFIGLVGLVPAYASLTILYDVAVIYPLMPDDGTVYDWVKYQVAKQLDKTTDTAGSISHTVSIPVCYHPALGNDLRMVAEAKGLAENEVADIHRSQNYFVYMPGFLPGFAYMGELDGRISMPRKDSPVPVREGAVGIAGLQTGIYPCDSPGGWHILGYTPVKLFDAGQPIPCLLNAGDTVRFEVITLEEFYNIKNHPAL